jgi:cytochrome c5
MNTSKKSKARVLTTFTALIAVMLIGGLVSTLCAADPKSDTPAPKADFAPASTNSVALNATAPDAKPAVVKKQLTGAELYSMHCNRCHPERYPTERTAAQWKTIMLHMQVRANLPVDQSKLILQYLQENSGR